MPFNHKTHLINYIQNIKEKQATLFFGIILELLPLNKQFMKRLLPIFILAVGLFGITSCSDDDDNNPAATTAKIRYNFMATKPGNYDVQYFLDTANANPSGQQVLNNSNVYDNTVTAPSGKVTKLLVLPPNNWTLGDTTSAILQIFVNDVLRAADTTTLTSTDLPGTYIIAPY